MQSLTKTWTGRHPQGQRFLSYFLNYKLVLLSKQWQLAFHDRTENSCTVSTSRCPIQSLRKVFVWKGFVWDIGRYLQCTRFLSCHVPWPAWVSLQVCMIKMGMSVWTLFYREKPTTGKKQLSLPRSVRMICTTVKQQQTEEELALLGIGELRIDLLYEDLAVHETVFYKKSEQ